MFPKFYATHVFSHLLVHTYIRKMLSSHFARNHLFQRSCKCYTISFTIFYASIDVWVQFVFIFIRILKVRVHCWLEISFRLITDLPILTCNWCNSLFYIGDFYFTLFVAFIILILMRRSAFSWSFALMCNENDIWYNVIL